MITYNKYNYYRNTYAVFKEVQANELPFAKWQYTSKSGSAYFYTKEGVYRKSNHWGRAAKCRWVLQKEGETYISKGRVHIGYASWGDFYPNDEHSDTYFIEVDFDRKIVTYKHKSHDTLGNEVYRTASATRKLIEKVKRVLLHDKWVKYYETEDIEQTRKELIDDLILS